MATFKVGDKVRYVGSVDNRGREWRDCPIGLECQITGIGADRDEIWEWVVNVPNTPFAHVSAFRLAATEHWADSCMLAPLDPPQSDAWATDAVRKVTKVHVEPVAPKVDADVLTNVTPG